MIDSFRNIAKTIEPLKPLAVAVGLLCLIVAIVTVLTSETPEGDRYLIPAVVGLLWSLSSYVFIGYFASVPEKTRASQGLLQRMKGRLHRGWYWFVALAFTATTLAAAFMSYRLVSIWLGEHLG
jgi:hypothetical protein